MKVLPSNYNSSTLITLGSFFLFLLAGCSPDQAPLDSNASLSAEESSNAGNAAEDGVVRFLYSDWPPDLIVYLADKKGYFEDNNVPVELIRVTGYEELLEKKASDNISYTWGYTLFETLAEQARGEETDAQVLLVQDFSAGADAVLAGQNSDINTIADLKGKKVGVESGTVGEFFLNILLNREELALDDINVVNLNSEEIPAALNDGLIEVGVAYEPDVSIAISNGAKLITDSSRERGVIVDVYVAKRSHVIANRDLYLGFVKSVLQAADFYNQNPDEAIAIMAQAYDSSPMELKEIFQTLEISNLRDNKTSFNRSSGFSSLYNLARQAEQFLVEQGVTSESLDFNALFDNNLVDEL